MSAPVIHLARPRPEHAKAWIGWREQPDAKRFNPFEARTLAELEQKLEVLSGGIIAGVEDAGWIAEVDGKPVGLVALRTNWRMRTTSVGYHLDASVHGQGLGTQLLRQGLAKMWSASDIRKVTATIHAQNIASKRVVERLGFFLEGRRRKEWVIDDEVVDVDAYSLLREEADRASQDVVDSAD